MPIVNRIPDLLAARFGGAANINLSMVERETGLNYRTVAAWAKGRVDRADFPTLAIWCKYFQCTVGDILSYQKEGADS